MGPQILLITPIDLNVCLSVCLSVICSCVFGFFVQFAKFSSLLRSIHFYDRSMLNPVFWKSHHRKKYFLIFKNSLNPFSQKTNFYMIIRSNFCIDVEIYGIQVRTSSFAQFPISRVRVPSRGKHNFMCCNKISRKIRNSLT